LVVSRIEAGAGGALDFYDVSGRTKVSLAPDAVVRVEPR
jgi:hypothetical protein